MRKVAEGEDAAEVARAIDTLDGVSAWVNDDIPPHLKFGNHERLLDILVRCDPGTALLGDKRHGERYQI